MHLPPQRHPTPPQQSVHLARMHKIEQHHHAQHRQRVEDVEEILVRQHEARRPLGVLFEPKDGSDEDQGAGEVEGPHVLFPGDVGGGGAGGGGLVGAAVEDDGDDEEEDEEDDLDEEAGCDDFLARVHGAYRLAGCDSCAWFVFFFRVRYGERLGFPRHCSPNACVTNDNTSPATKILVSHPNLTRE